MPTIDDYRATDALMRGPEGLEPYCRNLCVIQDKQGAEVPFVFNRAQRRLHKIAERQLDSKGWVRLIVLKGRQLGVSVYILVRLYRRTTLNIGLHSYILTHQDQATQNLFDRVKLLHDKMPSDYRHRLARSNANELTFDGINAGYRVGTAKNIKGGGRSLTLQNFHGSEVAFWQDATSHFAGSMKAVAKVAGSEIYLESTANGIGNEFHKQWGLAEKGESDFAPCFLPWMLGEEYRRPLEGNYEPSFEEEEYGKLYELTDEQVCWMHYENIELGGEPGKLCPLFHQEYPATAPQAFQMTGGESYIGAEYIARARRVTMDHDERHLPRVLGVDIGLTQDSTYLIDRRGRTAGTVINERFRSTDTMVIADHIGDLLNRHGDVQMCFIDSTGIGKGVSDYLRAHGHQDRVRGVNFANSATDPKRYLNKRAEMWGRLRDWLIDPDGASIPDSDDLHGDLAAPVWGPEATRYTDTNGRRLQIESKDRIKARLHFSPDAGDALALTFAATVLKEKPKEASWMDDYRDHGGDLAPPIDWQAF